MNYIAAGCMAVNLMCFAAGLGPIPLIYSFELFPQNVLLGARTILEISNWFINLLVTLGFPCLLNVIGVHAFSLFNVLTAVCLIFISIKVPETKNKTRGAILNTFNHKFNSLEPKTVDI
jgi:hypothetical protein